MKLLLRSFSDRFGFDFGDGCSTLKEALQPTRRCDSADNQIAIAAAVGNKLCGDNAATPGDAVGAVSLHPKRESKKDRTRDRGQLALR